MNRLTARLPDGTAYVQSETGTEGVGCFTTQRRLPELIARLARYEDTGLEPDEIEALKTIQRSEALECDCCTDKGHCPEYKNGDACVNDRVRKLHKEELNE